MHFVIKYANFEQYSLGLLNKVRGKAQPLVTFNMTKMKAAVTLDQSKVQEASKPSDTKPVVCMRDSLTTPKNSKLKRRKKRQRTASFHQHVEKVRLLGDSQYIFDVKPLCD